MHFSRILYTGSYVPDKIVNNFDLAKIVDTSDEWIVSRTGISQRHISEGDNTSDLAAKAAKSIMQKGGLNPLDIDLIIVATVSSDYSTPSTACLVQAEIGAENAVAFDVTAACSGFVFGLSIADKFIKCGVYRNALVIGSETLSKITDWNDRSTCVIFADGAAGAYIEKSEETGLLAENMGSDGGRAKTLTANHRVCSNAFNSIEPAPPSCIAMDGREIFNFATRTIPKSVKEIVNKTNFDLNEIKYIVPHQANSRIVEIVSKKIGVPMEKFYLNIERFGNTSSASIPIALNELNEKGLLERGDKILLIGFGGGLTWGTLLLEW